VNDDELKAAAVALTIDRLGMVDKANSRKWQGLKNADLYRLMRQSGLTAYFHPSDSVQAAFDKCLEKYSRLIEAELKQRNHVKVKP
jgi:hypothetical protein